VSHIPQLEEALESLVKSIKQLVRIYCQAFHTDFHLGTKIDQPWGKLLYNWILDPFVCTVVWYLFKLIGSREATSTV